MVVQGGQEEALGAVGSEVGLAGVREVLLVDIGLVEVLEEYLVGPAPAEARVEVLEARLVEVQLAPEAALGEGRGDLQAKLQGAERHSPGEARAVAGSVGGLEVVPEVGSVEAAAAAAGTLGVGVEAAAADIPAGLVGDPVAVLVAVDSLEAVAGVGFAGVPVLVAGVGTYWSAVVVGIEVVRRLGRRIFVVLQRQLLLALVQVWLGRLALQRCRLRLELESRHPRSNWGCSVRFGIGPNG